MEEPRQSLSDSQVQRALSRALVQRPERSTAAGAVGVPLATGCAWFIQEFMLPPGYVLDPIGATFLGGVAALVIGEAWLIWTRLKERLLLG